MNHKGTVKLETNRLILRRITMDDVSEMFDNWASNPNVTKFMTCPTHSSTEITNMVITSWVNNYENFTYYQWGIVIKETNQLIGSISVVKLKEDIGEVEIGYCIGEKWWHQGITSEAFSAIIPYLFEEVGANRIESQHDPHNPQSGNVMKKCGWVYEGTLRQADYSNKGIVDACIYSILKDDWVKSNE